MCVLSIIIVCKKTMDNWSWMVGWFRVVVDRFRGIHWLWCMVSRSRFMINWCRFMIYWSWGMISRSRWSIWCRSRKMNSMMRSVYWDTDSRVTMVTMVTMTNVSMMNLVR